MYQKLMRDPAPCIYGCLAVAHFVFWASGKGETSYSMVRVTAAPAAQKKKMAESLPQPKLNKIADNFNAMQVKDPTPLSNKAKILRFIKKSAAPIGKALLLVGTAALKEVIIPLAKKRFLGKGVPRMSGSGLLLPGQRGGGLTDAEMFHLLVKSLSKQQLMRAATEVVRLENKSSGKGHPGAGLFSVFVKAAKFLGPKIAKVAAPIVLKKLLKPLADKIRGKGLNLPGGRQSGGRRKKKKSGKGLNLPGGRRKKKTSGGRRTKKKPAVVKRRARSR